MHPSVLWILPAAAYALGSVSPAYLFGRALRGIDLRETGSGNLGARNAGRELGRGVGVTVWILDMAKGAAAVALARAAGAGIAWQIVAGACAVAGHNWPAWHGFRGGRGASTVMGAVFVILPLEMAIGLAVWTLVSLISGSLYLGGLIAYPLTTATAYLLGATGARAASPLLIALPLVVRHVPAVAEQLRTRRFRLP